jgi:hypothetical protein
VVLACRHCRFIFSEVRRLFSITGGTPFFRTSVADDGVVYGVQVNPYLVRPAGFEFEPRASGAKRFKTL